MNNYNVLLTRGTPLLLPRWVVLLLTLSRLLSAHLRENMSLFKIDKALYA